MEISKNNNLNSTRKKLFGSFYRFGILWLICIWILLLFSLFLYRGLYYFIKSKIARIQMFDKIWRKFILYVERTIQHVANIKQKRHPTKKERAFEKLKIPWIEFYFLKTQERTFNTTHTLAHKNGRFFFTKKSSNKQRKKIIFLTNTERKTDLNLCCAFFYFSPHSFLFRIRSLLFRCNFYCCCCCCTPLWINILRLFNRFLFQNDSNCSRYTTRLQSTVHVWSVWSECIIIQRSLTHTNT